jgi:hyaluronoglucosaminidase
MNQSSGFLTGVIEGFYGAAWDQETRLAYAGFLAALGLNTSLYCPKSDHYLRKQWQQHWPAAQWQELLALAVAYRQAGVNWGVGLSPFELYRHYGAAEQQQLKRKIGTLAELDAPLLAILFDDMPGELDALASRQAEIICDVISWLPDTRVLVCPTYYSFDPVLAKFFGRMPLDYWPTLGRELPDAVDIFWTGNRVCSDTITANDVEQINAQLGRPIVLWDNYPVNDGAVRSKFLYCSPLRGRESLNQEILGGHLCNAMNQGRTSLPALAGLAGLYHHGHGNTGLDSACLEQLVGARTWQRLQVDGGQFEQLGLDGIDMTTRLQLASQYQQLGEPAGAEVAAWLRGEYVFDPACLTD